MASQKCQSPNWYECSDGYCARSHNLCWSTLVRECPVWKSHVCPDGYCVHKDVDCMRPCGSKVRRFVYNQRCGGVNQSMCARAADFCPGLATDTCTRYRCHDGRCKTNALFCERCIGFRCRSGDCLPMSIRCDGKIDCESAEDELMCLVSPTYPTGGARGGFGGGAIGPASGFLLLVLLVLSICCRHQYNRRTDARPLRRLMVTLQHVREVSHVRRTGDWLRPRRQTPHQEPDTSYPRAPVAHARLVVGVPAYSPSSGVVQPAPDTDGGVSCGAYTDPTPPYSEVAPPYSPEQTMPPYSEMADPPPSYEEAVRTQPQPLRATEV